MVHVRKLNSLRENEQAPKTMSAQVGKWSEWEKCFFCPMRREEESLLVEWACRQGMTVPPHPPLLSNNYSPLTESRILNGWLTHGKLPMTPMGWTTPP